ncbi:MAG: hypothetical protein DHS20C15_14860 [Planctomycetota bacterium]|nr:MAG: hypothetical protein DHS20C15_14860 [Planctomycetota bacterium]
MRFLLLLALLAAPLARPAAQSAPSAADGGASPLSLHHDFPLVGQELRVVVEGFEPGAPVVLALSLSPADTAPSFLSALANVDRFTPVRGGVATFADDLGVFELAIELQPGLDEGHRIEFVVSDGGSAAVPVSLLVQAPSVLFAVDGGLARVNLLDGAQLGPLLEGPRALFGAGLESDGLRAWLLREQGRLESRSLLRWGEAPLTVRQLPTAGEALAHSSRAGAAFVLSSLGEGLFGRLHFVSSGREALTLEALESEPGHRRWAIAPDGERAFVAEDELLVREVDLRRGTLGGPFTAGVPGDTSITDMLVLGDQLLILTRRSGGRAGSLTRFNLLSGWIATDTLAVDPLRLVALSQELALVIPAQGGALTVIESGVPGVPRPLPVNGALLDAAPVDGGALLLMELDNGASTLLQFSASSYRAVELAAPGRWPHIERVLGAGSSSALLLGTGSEAGAIFSYELSSGALSVLPGLRREPAAPFVLLP